MVRKYRCKQECEHKPGSIGCLAKLMRGLIEEAAEVMLAIALYDHRAIKYEFGDVIMILRALGEYHPWTEEMMRLA